MKRIRLLAALFCCVAILALPVTSALPAAAETPEWNGWLYTPIFDGSRVQIIGYMGEETVLTVPATIDGLPVWAVARDDTPDRWNKASLTKVVFPDSVRVIFNVFRGCPLLEEVVLPANLFAVRDSFQNCPRIATVFLPDSVMELSDSFGYGAGEKSPYTQLTLHEITKKRFSTWFGTEPQVIPYDYSIGDLDADNAITSTDARLVLQQAAKKIVLPKEATAFADVDGDGEVTTTDARMILQKAVGKESGFEEDLATPEPLFSIDVDTAHVALYAWNLFDEGLMDVADPPIALPNSRALAEAAGQAITGPAYLQYLVYKMPPLFSLTLRWGDGTATETVNIGVNKYGLLVKYGDYVWTDTRNTRFDWWYEQLRPFVPET